MGMVVRFLEGEGYEVFEGPGFPVVDGAFSLFSARVNTPELLTAAIERGRREQRVPLAGNLVRWTLTHNGWSIE